jgi:hypothetical protein
MEPNPTLTPWVVLTGWLLPGSGYWLLGERARGAIVCLVVLAVFLMGMLIGGVRVIDAPDDFYPASLLAKPWFIGQILTGPISVVAALAANHVDTLRVAHGRSWELGTLYTAIAGMLNLLALIDSAHRSVAPGDVV